MRVEELVGRAPALFHTTAADGWPGIRARGLLPTGVLLDLDDLAPAEREELTTRRRPAARRFEHPEHGSIWIRDQRPLTESVLARTLVGSGWGVADYLRRLNGLAFLWVDPERLATLRSLPRYAREPQVELTVDTRSLLAAHHDRVVLTRINSGAAIFPSGRRGPDTFTALAAVAPGSRIVEVGVEGGVPDLTAHLVRVRRWSGGDVEELSW